MLIRCNPGPLFLVLLLDSRQAEHLAHTSIHSLPMPNIVVLVPRQSAYPWLHVVVEAQLHVVRLGNLAGGVGDLVLWTLVLDGEFTTGDYGSARRFEKARRKDGLRGKRLAALDSPTRVN